MSAGMLSVARRWWHDFVSLFFPEVCVVCGRRLVAGEEAVCLVCDCGMPRTGFHLDADNQLYYRLICRHPLERAAAMMHYSRHSPYSSVIITAKYHGRPEIARIVGRRYAAELAPCGFFSGVDALVPVPMHWWKKARRGYNQAEVVAEGVSEATGIPVIHDAMRAARHATQTRKDAAGRMANARRIYSVCNPALLEGKHIMLVDDVITTGATITACCEAIHKSVENCRVSVLALAATVSG